MESVFEVSPRDAAVTITRKLLSNMEERVEPNPFLEPTDIFTADVEVAVDRFRAQFFWHHETESPFPCLVTPGDSGNPIPVDLLPDNPLWWYFQYFPQYPPFLRIPFAENMFRLRELLQRSGLNVEPFSPGQALGFLETHLIDFLTTRFSARESNISRAPGLRFTVRANVHGLRVHYSPAYFVNFGPVFGSPTSPVISWIQPGRWKFGLVGPRPPYTVLQVDPGEYDIPPHAEAQLVV